jgi:SAM-dependent methyltransferase
MQTKREIMNESGKSAPQNVPSIEWKWAEADYVPEWHEPVYGLLAKYVPSNSKILEVGAGGSHTLGALAGRLNCKAYGIEPDRDGIMKTRQLAAAERGEVEMVCGDGFCLPFADGEFDVVYSLGLIEHFHSEQSGDMVAEHQRVCKPEGLVIVAVPNYLNLPHTLRKLILGKNYEYYPERSYTPRKLRKLLTSRGLRVIAMDGLLPLWGLAMISGSWRFIAVLDRLGISKKLNHLKNADWRANLGFMTYAVAQK